MIATFESAIYENDKKNFYILRYSTDDTDIPQAARKTSKDQRIHFIAKGPGLSRAKGVEVELTGKWVKHEKYGLQFDVELCTPLVPRSVDGMIGFLSSGFIKGIGPKIAKLIVDAFGARAYEVIQKEPDRLVEIKGISETKAKAIADAYRQSAGIREIITFLTPYGFTPNMAVKIQNTFKERAVDVLEKTPFELCKIPGIGFATADKIALETACQPNDPMRIDGAILFTMNKCANASGHMCVPLAKLTTWSLKLLNEPFEKKKKAEGLSDDEIPYVTEREVQVQVYDLITRKLLILDRDRRKEKDQEVVYLPFLYDIEVKTAEAVAKLLMQKTPVAFHPRKAIREAQVKLGIILSEKQIAGADLALTNDFAIVSGGPGTGKTTLLNIILQAYNTEVGGKVAMAAPSGLASQRMSKDGTTVHKLLGLISEDENAKYNSRKVLDADFVIIDETSMLNNFTAKELFTRLKPEAKVLFLGDIDQLPSVGAGNVLSELIHCGLVPTVFLDEVFRQAAGSRITLNAKRIRENNTDLLYGEDFDFIDADGDEEAAKRMLERYLEEIKVFGVGNVRLLSPFNTNGKSSVAGLNKAVQDLISHSTKEVNVLGRIFRVDDLVLHTKNDNGVSNGEIGYIQDITEDEDGNKIVKMMFQLGKEVEYSLEQMETVLLAYASTVHKAQGGEADVIIMPILNAHYLMLYRNILYTGITRARKKLILVGEKRALFIAIHREGKKRYTLLGTRIIDIHTQLVLLQGGAQDNDIPEQLTLIS